MTRRAVRFLPVLLGAVLLAACGERGTGGATDPAVVIVLPEIKAVDLAGRRLSVAVTTDILGDVVRRVAAGEADVTVLMPPGTSPHAYEPAPRAVAALQRADLVFVNGFGLETGVLDILNAMDRGPVVAASRGVTPIGDADGSQAAGGFAANPHVWFSPAAVKTWVANIEEALSAADPGNAAAYGRAAAAYAGELDALDRDVRRILEAVPPERRKLVMDHDSMAYFAAEYGFRIVGTITASATDQAEPSARDVAELADLVRREDIPAVFVGDTAGRGLKALAAAVAAESGRSLPVVELLTGSLAPAGSPGDDYLGFIRTDAERIAGALAP